VSAAVCVTVTAVAVVVLLVAQRPIGGVAKMIASTGFLALALVCGALKTPYGWAVFMALVLSWFGDLFLIFRGPKLFLAGLVSFFLAHAAFAIAFLLYRIALSWSIGTGIVLIAAAIPVWLWLSPHLGDMRLPVYAYVVIISIMVALSAGAVGRGGTALMLIGALLFYASDLSVARDRFIKPEAWNSLWGLPLYYGGQVALAYTVGLVPSQV